MYISESMEHSIWVINEYSFMQKKKNISKDEHQKFPSSLCMHANPPIKR